MTKFTAVSFLIFITLLSLPVSTAELEPIRVQLRWHHQFQFAGYYAAKQQGYYRDAGFAVTFIPGSPALQPVNEVLAGRAQFGVGNSEVLFQRLKGEPLVALAAIFQHSPSVLLTLKESNIERPAHLLEKTVMHVPNNADADIHAMLHAAGVREQQVNFVNSSYQLADLIEKRVDAFNGYLTNEPYYLQIQNIAHNVINPKDYGIDFYSDILFTSAGRAEDNANKVAQFRHATIKGWQYALAHQDEIIELIRYQYQSDKSIAHLRFEAKAIEKLVISELVDIGHIHPLRIKDMADAFIRQNMIEDKTHLAGFIFNAPNTLYEKLYQRYIIAVVACTILVIITVIFIQFTRRLNTEIAKRKAIESELATLANTDLLTKLPNRRAFFCHYHEELIRVKRYKQPLSAMLIDLDFFKQVNDTYGHQAGDLVLQFVSDIFQKSCRAVDMAARIGGEEFVILLPDTDEKEAEKFAQRILQQLRSAKIGDDEITITASIGIAQWHEQQKIDLIACADKAMYLAKTSGRDQIMTWSKIVVPD